MHTTIKQALTFLEEGNIAGYFEEVDKLQSQLSAHQKTRFSELKGIFIASKAPWDFDQILRVFAQQIGASTGEIEKVPTLNEMLTKQLIEAISPYSPDAQRIRQYVEKNNIKGWESQDKYAKKAKEVMVYSLVGCVGIQLSKLLAIAQDNSKSKNQKHLDYVEKCLFTAYLSQELVIFTLLSKLWDIQQKQAQSLAMHQKEVLDNTFFQRAFEPNFLQQHTLLATLYGYYQQQALALPFAEMKNFEEALKALKPLSEALQALSDALQKNKNNPQYIYNITDCWEAELHLAQLLQHFAFLANYKMAAIKEIGYKNVRNMPPPHYIHRYTALGIDSKANKDAEKFNYTPQSIATDAVLLYKGDDYSESINLFPFVIDYHALTGETGARICFFHHLSFTAQENLDYLFLEDATVQTLELNNVLAHTTDISQIIGDKEKYTQLNIDNVITQFGLAREALLGSENTSNTNTDDDFDSLFEEA